MMIIVWTWIIAGLVLAALPWIDPHLRRDFRIPIMPSGLLASLIMWIILMILTAPLGWLIYLHDRILLDRASRRSGLMKGEPYG